MDGESINNQSFITAYRKQQFQFRHAGGKTGLSASSQVLLDGVWPRSDGAYSRALRLWNGVMLDSDAEFPGHNPNHGIVTACDETTAWVHELQARSIENYIPKDALLKLLPNGTDRTRVYKYFDLSETQRKHYNLKRDSKLTPQRPPSKPTVQSLFKSVRSTMMCRKIRGSILCVVLVLAYHGFSWKSSIVRTRGQWFSRHPQRKKKLRRYSKRC